MDPRIIALHCAISAVDPVARAPQTATVRTSESPEPGALADVVVDIVSDVVCPWCYIGKRKLEAALAQLEAREQATSVSMRWHPFQLNPGLPAEGMARGAYLQAKFGTKARADEIYARVKAVGGEVGISFDFDRIARVPNTLDAHTMIAWTQRHGDARLVDALVERLFRAFFIEGSDLGDAELTRIAGDAGLPEHARSASAALRTEVEAEDREAREVGISGVPFFIFNGRTAVAGAHDPETLLKAIAAARAAD